MVGYCGSIGMAHLPHKGGTSSWRAVTYIYIPQIGSRSRQELETICLGTCHARSFDDVINLPRVRAIDRSAKSKACYRAKINYNTGFFFFRFLLLLYRLIASKSCFNVHIYIVRFYSNFVRIIFFFGFSKFNGWQFDLLFI